MRSSPLTSHIFSAYRFLQSFYGIAGRPNKIDTIDFRVCGFPAMFEMGHGGGEAVSSLPPWGPAHRTRFLQCASFTHGFRTATENPITRWSTAPPKRSWALPSLIMRFQCRWFEKWSMVRMALISAYIAVLVDDAIMAAEADRIAAFLTEEITRLFSRVPDCLSAAGQARNHPFKPSE